MRKIKIWYMANFTDRLVWRVTYPDGKRTRLQCWSDANELYKIFGGKLWIDYKNGWHYIK